MDDSGELLQNSIFDGVILLFFSLACAAWQAGRTEALGWRTGIAPGGVVGLARQVFRQERQHPWLHRKPFGQKDSATARDNRLPRHLYRTERKTAHCRKVPGRDLPENSVGQVCS